MPNKQSVTIQKLKWNADNADKYDNR